MGMLQGRLNWRPYRLLLGFLAASFTSHASAQVTTYFYTGLAYTNCLEAYLPVCDHLSITDSFAVSHPIAPNLSAQVFSPSSLSFSDGVDVTLGSGSLPEQAMFRAHGCPSCTVGSQSGDSSYFNNATTWRYGYRNTNALPGYWVSIFISNPDRYVARARLTRPLG